MSIRPIYDEPAQLNTEYMPAIALAVALVLVLAQLCSFKSNPRGSRLNCVF